MRSVAFRNEVAEGDDGISAYQAGGFEEVLQLGKAAVDVAEDGG